MTYARHLKEIVRCVNWLETRNKKAELAVALFSDL